MGVLRGLPQLQSVGLSRLEGLGRRVRATDLEGGHAGVAAGFVLHRDLGPWGVDGHTLVGVSLIQTQRSSADTLSQLRGSSSFACPDFGGSHAEASKVIRQAARWQ